MITRTVDNLSPNELELFKEWVLTLLHNDKADNLTITFRKSDGTDREMKGTLVPSAIPQDKVPTGNDHVDNADVQRVFDVDLGEWRSFRWDRVKQVSFDLLPN